MECIGHGIDIIEISRVEDLLNQSDEFLSGWFTAREIDELGPRSTQPEVVSGRIAAKEATVKALGTGFTDQVSWQDVEILENDTGAPVVALSGGARDVAESLLISQIVVSVSHARTMAIASVIAFARPPGPSPDS